MRIIMSPKFSLHHYMAAQSNRVKLPIGSMCGDEFHEKQYCTRCFRISGGKDDNQNCSKHDWVIKLRTSLFAENAGQFL